jgi:hypothetical protein
MVRELDQRSVVGLTVTLAWDDVANDVIVTVEQSAGDHTRSASVGVPPEQAAEAFAHPFIYVDPDGLAEAEVQASAEVASS